MPGNFRCNKVTFLFLNTIKTFGFVLNCHKLQYYCLFKKDSLLNKNENKNSNFAQIFYFEEYCKR